MTELEKIKIAENLRKIREKQKIGQGELAKIFKVNQSTISQIEHGKIAPSLEIIKNYISNFKICFEDLLLIGKGEMLQNSPPLEGQGVVSKGYPLLPIEAIGGIGTEIDVQIQNSDISTHYVVPEFDRIKPNFLIKVKGSSMVPKYNSGDIIAIKKITDKSIIQWNRPYVLDTDENGVMVKRINQTQNPDVWSLHSDNEKYPPFNMPLKNVRSIFLVVGVIRSE